MRPSTKNEICNYIKSFNGGQEIEGNPLLNDYDITFTKIDIESEESKSHYADAHLLKKAIADLSNPTNLTLIITNDKELRKNLRKQGCPVVFLRQRSHLVLEGFISD